MKLNFSIARACLALAIFCSGLSANAQQTIKADAAAWFTMLNRYQFNEKWSVSMETHERFQGFFKDQGNFLWRPSVDYKLRKEIIASVGYTYITTKFADSDITNNYITENNLWEQILVKQKFEKSSFQHRFRQEHRWVEQALTGGYSFQNRFRYRATYMRGLHTFKNDDGLFVHVFDELWMNQGTGILPRNFGRNWLYMGLGYAFTDNMNIQTGYMHQFDRLSDELFVYTPIWQSTFVWNF